MIIKINENQYNNIFLLVEGAEANNEKAARDYLRTKRRLNDEQALRVIGTVKHDIPNSRLAKSKFMLGVVRISCEDRVVEEDMIKLNTLLKYIASEAHVNEYDRNLNGLSFDEINQKFSIIMQDNMEGEKTELSKLSYTKRNDYTIVPIKSFEEATKYSGYASWCVTKDEQMYNKYTYDGIGCFYFCLRDGFESVPAEPGNGKPLDNYGLSMIAVSVTPEGAPNTITCRWNHDNGGNDSVMDAKKLSLLLGDSFYNMFPPKYTKEQLRELGYVGKDEAIEYLRTGGNPMKIMKTLNYLVRRNDKDIRQYVGSSYLVESEDGEEEVNESDFYDYFDGNGVKFYYIKYDGGCRTLLNIDNGEDEPALANWVNDFSITSIEDVYITETNKKYNIYAINISSQPILRQDLDGIDYRSLCNVDKIFGYKYGSKYFTFIGKMNGRFALFNSKGEQMSDWLRHIFTLNNHIPDYPYRVSNDERKMNYLGVDGTYKFATWHDNITEPGDISKNRPAVVVDNNIFYIVSPDGKQVLSDGYKHINLAYYRTNPYENFMNTGRNVFECTLNDGNNIYLEYTFGKLVQL